MRIAVVGGGIGGLAACLALAGPGREITLYERRTGFTEAGAGIQLSPNATRILDRLGLLPALRRVAVETPAIAVRAFASGRDLARIGLGPAMAARFGAPYLAIARADLHTVLLDAVRARRGVRLRLGREVEGVDQTEAAATLAVRSTAGAVERVEADLVVGADGLWSRLRKACDRAPEPRPSGHAAYRALIARELASGALWGPDGGLWLGPGRHVVHYPVAAGGLLNVVIVAPSRAGRDGWSTEVSQADVADALDGAVPDLAALAGLSASWRSWTLHDLPARRMAKGRLALLGDAAHPVLPYLAQGGALAIEDAACLASALADAPGDVPAALVAYGRERQRRARRVQKAARRNGFAYHAGAPASWVRDAMLRRMAPEDFAARYAWLYGWMPAAPSR